MAQPPSEVCGKPAPGKSGRVCQRSPGHLNFCCAGTDPQVLNFYEKIDALAGDDKDRAKKLMQMNHEGRLPLYD